MTGSTFTRLLADEAGLDFALEAPAPFARCRFTGDADEEAVAAAARTMGAVSEALADLVEGGMLTCTTKVIWEEIATRCHSVRDRAERVNASRCRMQGVLLACSEARLHRQAKAQAPEACALSCADSCKSSSTVKIWWR